MISANIFALLLAVGGQDQLPMPKLGVKAPAVAAQMEEVQGNRLHGYKKGTVYVLEFWATWCGSCVPAITHINELTTKFKGRPIEFHSIADKTSDSLSKFMVKHPFVGNVQLDFTGDTFKAFGIQVIPRTAIIDQEGKLLTIAEPESITDEVLEKILAKQPVTITTATNKAARFDWDKDVTKGSLAHVLIRPSDSDGGGSRMVPGSGQLTADGMSLQNLVSRMYDASFFDMKWEYEPEKFKYRVSVKAPDGKDETALKMLRDVADQMFDYVATWEMIDRDVVVVAKTGEHVNLTASTMPKEGGFAHGGEILWPNCDMKTLCSLFQNFMYGKTVINQIGDDGRYDIHLKWVPGDKESIEHMLSSIGLKVSKTHQSVLTLVVRQKPSTVSVRN